MWLAARALGTPEVTWQRLSLGLVPMAGVGVFLGLSMLTLGHLKAEGVSLIWVPVVRAALLLLGGAFSADLATDTHLLDWARKTAPVLLDRHPELAERHVARWLGGKAEFLKA